MAARSPLTPTANAFAHQALHGYRRGHRLLEASVDLSVVDRQFLAAATDRSDAGRLHGWDGLLAGYQLPDSGLYALSVTWSAPEMARPGCVWAHTLLLEIGELPDRLVGLDGCFARPTNDAHGSYSTALPIPDGPYDPEPTPTAYRQWSETVRWALYDAPVRPVECVVRDLDARQRHRLLLELWSEQWSDLRATFSFAEAPALRPHVDRRPLDLLLMGRPEGSAPPEVRSLHGPVPRRPPAWVTTLALAAEAVDSELFPFLETLGAQVGNDRSAMAGLAELWRLEQDPMDAEQRAQRLVQLVSNRFPHDQQLAAFKHSLLLGGQSQFRAPVEPTAFLLHAIEASPTVFGAEPNDVRHCAQVATLAPTLSAIELLRLAARSPRTAAAECVLAGFADSLENRTALEAWADADWSALKPVVKARPGIATSTHLWRCADASALWDAVRGVRSQGARAGIFEAAWEADACLDPPTVLAAWPTTLRLVADKWDQADSHRRAEAWLMSLDPSILAAHAAELSEYPALFEAVITDVDVAHAVLAQVDTTSITRRSLVRIFRNAIASDTPTGPLLACRTYDQLYRDAREEHLDDARDELANLAEDIPDWDLAQRLARALNRAFKTNLWSTLPLLDLKDDLAFAAVLAADNKAGLARRLVQEAAQAGRYLPPGRQAVVAHEIAERSDRSTIGNVLRDLFGFLGRR